MKNISEQIIDSILKEAAKKVLFPNKIRAEAKNFVTKFFELWPFKDIYCVEGPDVSIFLVDDVYFRISDKVEDMYGESYTYSDLLFELEQDMKGHPHYGGGLKKEWSKFYADNNLVRIEEQNMPIATAKQKRKFLTEFEYIRNKVFTIYFGKFYDEGRSSNQIITIYSPNGVDFVQYDENDRKEIIEALSAWLKPTESFGYEYTFEEKDWTDDFAYAVFKITIDTIRTKFKIEPSKINVTQKSGLEKAIEDGVLLGIDKWNSLEEFTSFAKRMGFKVENAGKVGPGQRRDSFNFFAKLGNKFYGSFDNRTKSGFLYSKKHTGFESSYQLFDAIERLEEEKI